MTSALPLQLLPLVRVVPQTHELDTTMHPDSVMLQGHGVTSPRLCSASSASSSLGANDMMAAAAYMYAKNGAVCEESSPMSMDDDERGGGEDGASCCSEDSELSVGQEDGGGGKQRQFREPETDTDQHDECSNDSMCQMMTPPGGQVANGGGVAAMRTALPAANVVPIVRPSPTRFQEEFLRKSHIYAEELMKQQMQFMAAARASAFSLRQQQQPAAEIGFRPPTTAADQTLPNFSGIHSHLSSISKIGAESSALSKLTAFGMAAMREPSQSPPPAFNHLHHLPAFLNNNLHDSNLKFSIDNILKADFGRRITDPLLKRSSGGAGGSHKKHQKDRGNRTATATKAKTTVASAAPIDLTPMSSSTPASSICSNSNDSSSATAAAATAAPTAAATATSGGESATGSGSSSSSSGNPIVWPAWVYCTRYSDRPSSGPRTKKPKKSPGEKIVPNPNDEKRPRTAFSGSQLARLKHEFTENRYLTEKRRQQLSNELGLNEAQIKIWFQNKRAKIKKSTGTKNPLALQLMAQGLYNHSTVPLTKEEEELQALQAEAGSP